MRRHLTDSEMTETLGGEPAGDTRAHLADCPACRAERDRLQAALSDLAAQVRGQAMRPEASWERQRRQIARQLRETSTLAPSWRWAWALTAVVLVVLIVVWFHGKPPQPLPATAADHTLLLAVERSLQTECPVALRPAGLLAAEAEQGGAAGRGADTLKGDQL